MRYHLHNSFINCCFFALYLIMGLYFFLRYGIAGLAFVAWLFYKKQFKQKQWADLKPDIIAVTFFIAVWMGISYWAMN